MFFAREGRRSRGSETVSPRSAFVHYARVSRKNVRFRVHTCMPKYTSYCTIYLLEITPISLIYTVASIRAFYMVYIPFPAVYLYNQKNIPLLISLSENVKFNGIDFKNSKRGHGRRNKGTIKSICEFIAYKLLTFFRGNVKRIIIGKYLLFNRESWISCESLLWRGKIRPDLRRRNRRCPSRASLLQH